VLLVSYRQQIDSLPQASASPRRGLRTSTPARAPTKRREHRPAVGKRRFRRQSQLVTVTVEIAVPQMELTQVVGHQEKLYLMTAVTRRLIHEIAPAVGEISQR
jgi:hypothetical protein